LFNVGEDPEELLNLAKKHAKKFHELEEELRGICDPQAESACAEAFIARQVDAVRAMGIDPNASE